MHTIMITDFSQQHFPNNWFTISSQKAKSQSLPISRQALISSTLLPPTFQLYLSRAKQPLMIIQESTRDKKYKDNIILSLISQNAGIMVKDNMRVGECWYIFGKYNILLAAVILIFVLGCLLVLIRLCSRCLIVGTVDTVATSTG